MQKIRVLELFAGLGACSKALERLGIEHEIVDAVEIDKYAIKSFNAVHGTNFEPQDITKWDKDIKVDLIMHGSPCQDFSVAGRQAGGDEGSGTRSSLMYETIRIVDKLRPKYVIWENVKNLLSAKHRHNFEAYQQAMSDMGYTNYYKVLNAEDYGIPQHRERVFTVSILNEREREYEWPEPVELEKRLKDMLESNVDEKYYLSNKQVDTFMSDGTGNYPRRERFLQNINRKRQDIGNSVTTRAGQRPTDNFVIDDTYKNRPERIYDGKSPTLRTGTVFKVTEPICAASRGRNLNNPSDRTPGQKLTQVLEPKLDGTTNTLTSVEKDNYVIEPTLKEKLCDELVDKGIVKGGEVINHSYTTSNQRQELSDYIETDNGVTPTLTTRPDILGYAEEQPTLRIRKLTPKEYWRLMGFDDADYEKAEKVNSATQLYKQAGNSIVVNVLEGILKNLLTEEKCKQKSTSQMRLWN